MPAVPVLKNWIGANWDVVRKGIWYRTTFVERQNNITSYSLFSPPKLASSSTWSVTINVQ